LTEINFGMIKAELIDNQLSIKQLNPKFEKEIRRYARISENSCKICLLPSEKCQNHDFFLDKNEKPILNMIKVASYYKKKPFNRITEELTFIRSRDNLHSDNLIFIIFKEILKTFIFKFGIIFNTITSPPTKYKSIKKIITKTAEELKISYTPIETLIQYNEDLHNKKKIRNINDPKKIADLVREIYKTKNKDYSEIENLLIVDDLIRTGATINRISLLLKEQGIKSVYGFTWLRTIGSDLS